MIFQHHSVRASIKFYLNFTLLMGRSHGFGSTALNFIALLRLDFSTLSVLYTFGLLSTITRWPVLQKVRHRTI